MVAAAMLQMGAEAGRDHLQTEVQDLFLRTGGCSVPSEALGLVGLSKDIAEDWSHAIDGCSE